MTHARKPARTRDRIAPPWAIASSSRTERHMLRDASIRRTWFLWFAVLILVGAGTLGVREQLDKAPVALAFLLVARRGIFDDESSPPRTSAT